MKNKCAIPREVPASVVEEHLRKYDNTNDPDFLETLSAQIRKHRVWVLRNVPISRLDSGESRDLEIIQEYASLSSQPPPIIVDEDGFVIDGGHRTQAAQFLRQRNICAYIPRKRR